MLNAASSVCIRCRQSLLKSSPWQRSFQTSSVLQRHKVKQKSPPPTLRQLIARPTRHTDFLPPPVKRPQHHFKKESSSPTRFSSPNVARQKLNEGMYRWARLPATIQRFRVMGLPKEQAKALLNSFVEERPRTPYGWFPPDEDFKWQMARIQDDMAESLPRAVDRALTRRFMAWALQTTGTGGRFPPSVYNTLAAVQNAVDFTHPAEWYPVARMLRRKIHMHVGPTNSGKTHNALRALASSNRGVYASPLRLLAYEVFDRLNKGLIIPLDVDPSTPRELCKRQCDLVTGEEVRKVGENTPLLSCTVEMLDMNRRFEVAVVDEVQMLSDADRGGAWTAAVLGLHAEELHLCGEEGAVPLVQEMLRDTGDELIVHRYERLTPLVMANQSLNGDLRKIEKGDCVVAFSRAVLFALKKEIEKVTGMRCAIVYGRLPPEVRTEQAELFNDSDSGYDVLVGSDAIGMGLNLKIKRIVFESSCKYDGDIERTLSLSQLKQIAGRAGRYGMHDVDVGGVVTTLHEEDLPAVRKAVESRSVPVAKRAVLPATKESYHSLEQLIRSTSPFSAILDVLRTTALMEPFYTLPDVTKGTDHVLPILDRVCADFTLDERLGIMHAPVQWRDASVAHVMEKFLRMYKRDSHVKFLEGLKGLKLLESLDKVKEMQTAQASSPESPVSDATPALLLGSIPVEDVELPPDATTSARISAAVDSIEAKSQPPPIDVLLRLESLYRVSVIYMWFNMRFPLVFNERDDAVHVKEEVEEAIEWYLERLMHAKARDRARARARRKTESKEGVEGKGEGVEVHTGEELEQAKKHEEGKGGRGVEGEKKKKRRELKVDGLDDDVPRKQRIEIIRGKHHRDDPKRDNKRVEELEL